MGFRKNNKSIDVDEVFMDVRNIPGYHRENFEGMLENPIGKRMFAALGVAFLITGFVFLSRVGFLEVARGEAFRERATKNYLRTAPLEPERGIIYDRDGNALTVNERETTPDGGEKWTRRYPKKGFLHVIGFLTRKDDAFFARGVSGLELMYDEILRGEPGKKLEEVNATGEVVESGTSIKSQSGENILTTIDSNLQIKLTEAIEATARDRGFVGGAGVVLDLSNGEVLAIASAPEFDPNILSKNTEKSVVQKLITDPKKPFFLRSVSGLYPPGSIAKLAVAAGALNEHIIDPKKQILSTGSISVPNPFNKDLPTIFPDWKAHGWVDMVRALAVSSNVYFYAIGGGYEDQQGLGVSDIERYLRLFGFGEKTGIDLPGEKQGSLPDPKAKQGGRKWSIGDTYHLAIGQGDLQVTPVQMAVYVSAIASRGTLLYPHIVRATVGKNKKVIEQFSYTPKKVTILPDEVFTILHEGMREAVRSGTASGLSGLPVSIGAKTGTAELGDTGRVNSWSIGFLPYENPKIAFAILMENGDRNNTIGATFVASEVIRWISDTNFLQKIE